MNVAIMIPMDDAAATNANYCTPRPDGWTNVRALAWPELLSARSGWHIRETAASPPFPRETADLVQHLLSKANRNVVIVTRSEIVVLRVRRMIAEGAQITAAVYLVTAAGQERHEVKANGEMANTWPETFFLDAYREVLAIQRAAKGAT